MNDILVVLRAEDAVVDFLSLLAPAGGTAARVLLCDTGETLSFAAGTGSAERLTALAARVRPADGSAASPGTADLTERLRRLGADGGTRVWTHSPPTPGAAAGASDATPRSPPTRSDCRSGTPSGTRRTSSSSATWTTRSAAGSARPSSASSTPTARTCSTATRRSTCSPPAGCRPPSASSPPAPRSASACTR
ncbi:hypothetical protein ACFQ60_43075 [Streptomyces zhihengii]